MGTVSRSTLTDDDGSGTTGSIVNNSELQKVYDNVEAEVKSASNPTITTKSIIDNVMAGIPFLFGGTALYGVLQAAYPSGASFDKLAPNTSVWHVDASLLTGTYKLEAILAAETPATISLALVNLSDGSPDTAIVTITSASTTGQRVQSGAITFAAPGVAKDYGVKIKTDDATKRGYAWGIRVIRV